MTLRLALLLLLSLPAQAQEARVIDGDTLAIGRDRIRLQNHNAPELDQPGGPEAKAKLESLTAGKHVTCEPKARDRYARIVARCYVEGRDIGKAMK